MDVASFTKLPPRYKVTQGHTPGYPGDTLHAGGKAPRYLHLLQHNTNLMAMANKSGCRIFSASSGAGWRRCFHLVQLLHCHFTNLQQIIMGIGDGAAEAAKVTFSCHDARRRARRGRGAVRVAGGRQCSGRSGRSVAGRSLIGGPRLSYKRR